MDYRLTLAAVLLLAACGGSPFPDATGGDDGEGDGDSETVTVPESLAVNVTAARYDATSDSLRLSIAGLDSSPALVTYQRNADLDVGGYRAYSIQEDPLDRMFVALARESRDGATRAVAVADGGQFGHYFGGGSFERDGNFDRPPISAATGSGQVTYAGTYAALQNIPAAGNPDVLTPPAGTADELLPNQPRQVRGNILLNANFSDDQVNGVVYNRVVVNEGTSLPQVILAPTEIAENGTFTGSAENPEGNNVDAITGNYGGIFGGSDSSSVAGVVHLETFNDDIDLEQEHGVFVLTQCGQPGDAAICDTVEPN